MQLAHKVSMALNKIFNHDAMEIQSLFIKREREVTGANFLKTNVMANLKDGKPTNEALVREGYTHGLNISAQAISNRFTEKAFNFFESALNKVIEYSIYSDDSQNFEILNRFSSVNICDTSTLNLPDFFNYRWKGLGDKKNKKKSSMKLDASIEFKCGELKLNIVEGVMADNKTPSALVLGEKDSLCLRDLGYMDLMRMKEQSDIGVVIISRLKTGTKIFEEDGSLIDLVALLNNLKKNKIQKFEKNILVGNEKLPMRIIIFQLPPKQAQKKSKKITRKAKKNKSKVSKSSKTLFNWAVYITNAPKEKISLDECYALYRMRWQIEMIFKLWKDVCMLDESKSKKEWRILCEIYVKLIVIIIKHWIVLTGLWEIKNKSLTKGFKLIGEQSARFSEALNNTSLLTPFIKEFKDRFKNGCAQNQRKKYPNAYRVLELTKEGSLS